MRWVEITGDSLYRGKVGGIVSTMRYPGSVYYKIKITRHWNEGRWFNSREVRLLKVKNYLELCNQYT